MGATVFVDTQVTEIGNAAGWTRNLGGIFTKAIGYYFLR
jgi:hypothetical protein